MDWTLILLIVLNCNLWLALFENIKLSKKIDVLQKDMNNHILKIDRLYQVFRNPIPKEK